MNTKYIREIADALSDKHAVLMVGAGFSKNAEKIANTDKKFLSWNELSDLFYETIYEKSEEPGKEYLSSLRLAQEVEITVGRPKLEKIIKEAVPDLEYAPSDLYVKLLDMPWRDVFTTNYDTLLERTADKITKRRYNVVVCQEDLVNSNDAPRILKLHGSFPSYRPFIITEEDYRTYPVKFAAMVNTVQQALLENVFCMLGFSCEDPNFINWIGWIHDNLGKSSSQKIYMVSVSHIEEAKRRLLFEQNIIVIDLEEFCPGKEICDRLNFFLEELNSRVEEKQRKDNWFDVNNLNLQFNTDFLKKTEIMHNLNEAYPGWIFLPWKMKKKVNFILRELEYMNGFKELTFHDQVNYMYEYVRFMEVSGRPILSQIVNEFWETLEKNNLSELDDKIKNEMEYRSQVIYLHLLRSYRELAEWEKYEICHEKIKCECLNYDNKQFLHACDCWERLYRFQSDNLARMLESWNLAKGDVYWPIIKANMYALVGEITKADVILSDTLVLVRRQLVKESGNEYLSSVEESIVSLINFIRQGSLSKNVEECIHEKELSWWNENDKYCLHLNTEGKNKDFETRDDFDLSPTYTIRMGTDNSNVFYAMEYLRFLEQTGHPFRLQNITNTKGLHSTIEKLSPYYPHWCLMQILIAQKAKYLDVMFGRVELAGLTQDEADSVAKEYLKIFGIVMNNVKPENHLWAKSIYEQSAAVLPDILARFCYKCSTTMLDEIFNVILDLCISNVRTNFKGIQAVFKGLFTAYTDQEQEERIGKVLQFPMDIDRISKYCDPIAKISKPKEKYVLDMEVYNRVLFQIKQSLSETDHDKREAAINRWVILAQIAVLNEEDKKELCNELAKEKTLENYSILYTLDKQRYMQNKTIIFDKILTRMKSDSSEATFPSEGNNYSDLIRILKDIDVNEVDFENVFEVMNNLVLTNFKLVKKSQPNANERIRQSFLIAVGLFILRCSKKNDLSKKEQKKVLEYFAALKDVYRNSGVVEMIESCLLGNVKIVMEDFRKDIWLCDDQGLSLLKDFYDVFYINNFNLKDNDIIFDYANLVFEISVYKAIACDIFHVIPSLKLCYSLVQNDISSETELKVLIASLPKFQDETVILKFDSEQEAIYKLKCRIITCKIAKELYSKGIREESIMQWKAVSEDKNEFIEIRNIKFEDGK